VLCLVLPGVVAVYAFAEFVWLLRRSRRADFTRQSGVAAFWRVAVVIAVNVVAVHARMPLIAAVSCSRQPDPAGTRAMSLAVMSSKRQSARRLWNTLRHERCVSDDRPPRPHRRDDGVREEHARTCARGKDRFAGDSPRRPLLEAGLGATVRRRVARTATRAAAGEAWIIDGNYNETLVLRPERAETVIYLDSPWWLCASRAFVRGLRKPVGEMPEGCEDSVKRRLRDEWGGVGRIWRNRRSAPEYARSEIFRHRSHTTVHVLRSRREARAFLDAVCRERTPSPHAHGADLPPTPFPRRT
jgi:hypothetical protein